jgi:hypothetical protein
MRTSTTRIVRGLAVLIATAIGATVAGTVPAHAATPLTCGSVVTTNVVLQNDITGCQGNGLVVARSEITIDLNKHLVSGVGACNRCGNGIENEGGYSNVVVKNGRVQGFLNGVMFSDTPNSQVTGLELTGNGNGVYVSFGSGDVIANNTIGNATGIYGGRGISVAGGDSYVVQNNIVKRAPGGVGIYVTAGWANVTGNTVTESAATGIVVNAQGQVSGNRALSNNQYGIDVTPYMTTVKGNTASQNGSDGIIIRPNSGPSAVGSNVANDNLGRGITGSVGVSDAGANQATGNHLSPQCTYVHC